MTAMNILIVEDDHSIIKSHEINIKAYQRKSGKSLTYDMKENLHDALEALKSSNSSYDGAIIDINLAGESDDEGMAVVDEISKHYRIPMMIITGTPGKVNNQYNKFVTVHKRGEVSIEVILAQFHNIYDTGITKILGGRGQIELTMNNIFWNNILPNLEPWVSLKTNPDDKEKALLRYTISHLHEYLDEYSGIYFPAEMYITQSTSDISTGSIVKNMDVYFIVLSPACDIVMRKEKCKTDRILLCEIDDFKAVSKRILEKIPIKKTQGYAEKQKMQTDTLKTLIKNSFSNYYHYLPDTAIFTGGLINFRWIRTVALDDFNREDYAPTVKVASFFVKDIVSRFSSFYARQGQPDFDFEKAANDKYALLMQP